MLKASLSLQILFDRQSRMRDFGMHHLAVDVFLQRPHAGFYRQLADIDRFARIIVPTGGTGRQCDDQPRAFELLGFLNFAGKIERFGADDGRDIGRFVCRPDSEQVFLVAGKAAWAFTGRGPGRMRCGARKLLAGVAIALVVVADVEKIQTPFDGPRGGLQTHAVGRTVAGQHHHLQVFFAAQALLLKENIQGVAYALSAGWG